MKINYQQKLDEIINNIKKSGSKPTLLLHSCCAPCSSYVLEYIAKYFDITILYYNPNIFPKEEYYKRYNELQRLLKEMPLENPVKLLEPQYDSEEFFKAVKGLEHIREGGERCFACYRLRLEKTARIAAEKGFDYFTTTLSISPYKNAQKLNEISDELGGIYKVNSLPSDFKKRNGYKRSIELSKIYNLYRQNYCGCVFSRQEREEKEANS